MKDKSIAIARPQRWDHPLDRAMAPAQVDFLLTQSPLNQMDPRSFASYAPLTDILKNDSRLHKLAPGDVIFQKGQYGGSAYLVIRGRVRMFLSDALAAPATNSLTTGQRRRPAGSDWIAWFRRHARASTADSTKSFEPRLALRGQGAEARMFLQDVPGVLDEHATTVAEIGELFGELAAVTRAAREFTAVAETDCLVLEIRWQGLKLLKQSPEFRGLLDGPTKSPGRGGP